MLIPQYSSNMMNVPSSYPLLSMALDCNILCALYCKVYKVNLPSPGDSGIYQTIAVNYKNETIFDSASRWAKNEQTT